MEKYVTITTRAKQYLQTLLEEQSQSGLAIRIFVENPGSTEAVCCMAFCNRDEPVSGDKPFYYGELLVFLDKESTPFLKNATLDCWDENGVQTLKFDAPHAVSRNPEHDALMDTFLEQYRRGLVKR